MPASAAPLRALDALNVSDKLVHFTAYLILMLLPALHETRLVTALLAFGIVLLGALLEFGQVLIPSRSPEVADALANLIGVLCGLAIAALIRVRSGVPEAQPTGRHIL